jgi:hypothetical protein
MEVFFPMMLKISGKLPNFGIPTNQSTEIAKN